MRQVRGGLVDLNLTYQDFKLVMDSLGFLSVDPDEDSETKSKSELKSKIESKSKEEDEKIEILDEKEAKRREKRRGYVTPDHLSEVTGVHVRHLKSTSKVADFLNFK